MKVSEIKAELDALGVEYPQDLKKPELASLLEAAQAPKEEAAEEPAQEEEETEEDAETELPEGDLYLGVAVTGRELIELNGRELVRASLADGTTIAVSVDEYSVGLRSRPHLA